MCASIAVMIIDGKQIANELKEKIARVVTTLSVPPILDLVVVGEDPVIESFVRIKKRIGGELRITLREHRFPDDISGESLKEEVARIALLSDAQGLIIQLPLPSSIDAQSILDVVPLEKDVDMLSRNAVAAFASGESKILPPVAAAIQEILERAGVNVSGEETLVLGHGRLVGVPASILLRHNGAHVTVIDKEISHLSEHTKESRIIIAGVGKPGLITPDMLSPGTVLIDAGTSETGGKIVGDAHPDCALVAGVFTPVPGGVGPIAVVMIFKNLCILARSDEEDRASRG